jgi:hypothetical protein
MDFIGTPSRPGQQTRVTFKFRESFALPEAGDDQQFVYLTAIREDAPLFDYHIAGVDFAQRILPPDASLIQNEGRAYNYKLPTKLLTEKQFGALRKELGKRTVVIPARPNINFNPILRPDEPEYWPREEIDLLPLLIFKKASEYQPGVELEEKLKREDEPEPADAAEALEKKVYDAQKKVSSKK